MDPKQLQDLATELAKNLKTPDVLNQLSHFLKKLTVETTLNAKLTRTSGPREKPAHCRDQRPQRLYVNRAGE